MEIVPDLASRSAVIDIRENTAFSRRYLQAIEEARGKAMHTILRDHLRPRFSRLPKWASERLASASAAEPRGRGRS